MKIQIIKTYKESFKDVWHHKLEWIRVAYAPLCVWALAFLFMGVTYFSFGYSLELQEAMTGQTKNIQPTGDNAMFLGGVNIFYTVINFVVTLMLYVNGYRYGVLKEGGDHWWTLNLDRRLVKIFLYTLLIGVMAGIYFFIAAGITFGAHYLFESVFLTVILGIFLALYGIYLFFRLSLVLLLVAIDRVEPFKSSWRLLKGNTLPLIGLTLLVSLTMGLVGILGLVVIALFGAALYFITPILAVVAGILLFLFGIIIWFFFWAVYSKALTFVYKTVSEEKAS